MITRLLNKTLIAHPKDFVNNWNTTYCTHSNCKKVRLKPHLRAMSEVSDSIKSEDEHLLCSQYLSQYDALHSWAFNSLDIIKEELIPLCFPLFVHW